MPRPADRVALEWKCSDIHHNKNVNNIAWSLLIAAVGALLGAGVWRPSEATVALTLAGVASLITIGLADAQRARLGVDDVRSRRCVTLSRLGLAVALASLVPLERASPQATDLLLGAVAAVQSLIAAIALVNLGVPRSCRS